MEGAKVVSISVLDQHEEAADLIRNSDLPVTVTDISSSSITTEVRGGREHIASINKLLVQNNIKVYSLSEDKADLEDLYMAISSDQEEQEPA